MVSVGRHENISLLSYSEVENVSGYVGNYQVRVRRKARFVDETSAQVVVNVPKSAPWM